MKDEHDKQMVDIPEIGASAQDGLSAKLGKPKRLPQQVIWMPPVGAKAIENGLLGFGRSVVPVASVARDWSISARRVRMMFG